MKRSFDQINTTKQEPCQRLSPTRLLLAFMMTALLLLYLFSCRTKKSSQEHQKKEEIRQEQKAIIKQEGLNIKQWEEIYVEESLQFDSLQPRNIRFLRAYLRNSLKIDSMGRIDSLSDKPSLPQPYYYSYMPCLIYLPNSFI